MIADWKPIETAPKDREIMASDGKRIEPATWDANMNWQYVDEPIMDEFGELQDRAPQGAWICNGLTSDESDREIFATHWDEMPQLP